jgi:hypothetical protein
MRKLSSCSNVISSSFVSCELIACVVSAYVERVPQLRSGVGAAEKAVPRHHGSGDQTST